MNALKVTALVIGFILLTACALVEYSSDKKPPVSNIFNSDVLNIKEQHLSVDYWLNNNPNSRRLIKDKQAVQQFNRTAFSQDKHLVNLNEFVQSLGKEELQKIILSLSTPAKDKRVYQDGSLVTEENYKNYHQALNLNALKKDNAISYGLIVNRTDMRTFPTDDRIFKSVPSDIDRFQETALFPSDTVLILHKSTSGEWLFVQSYNYAAWIKSADVALGSRDQVLAYMNAENYVTITGDKVHTNFNPEVPSISELQLDMGTRLPLALDGLHNVHGQNPYTSYAVQIPVRSDQGELNIETALIALSRDVTVGSLPYTEGALLTQAFKFLGERYGWGHSYNGRDCSGFTSEIYKTIGIYLPRNSGQQAHTPVGDTINFDENDSLPQKLAAIEGLEVGDLIFIPGHVMMFIGKSEGQPYVIHDVTSLNYYDQHGEYYSGILNGVSVTPLLPLHIAPTQSYVDSIYSIKKFK